MHEDPCDRWATSSSRTARPPTLAALFPDTTARAVPRMDAALAGKRVLVTGAGGSVGRALMDALLTAPLQHLVLADTSEHALVELERSFFAGNATQNGARPTAELVLADLRLVADRERMLAAARPDVVIHAAAYKHVAFLEARPVAAVENNLLATLRLVRAARAAGAQTFVFVSTDKAVAPTGVMGRTKAAAEAYLRAERRTGRDAHAAENGQATRSMRIVTVRLANVFGSRGSVVPYWLGQLNEGRPLPVTDPAMQRWFIGREAAAQAILAGVGQRPGTYIPTACREVSILDLARRLLRWHDPSADPETQIEVVGRRPGERLREALLASDEQPGTPTGDGLVRTGEVSVPSRRTLRRWTAQLQKRCRANDASAVRRLLTQRPGVPKPELKANPATPPLRPGPP